MSTPESPYRRDDWYGIDDSTTPETTTQAGEYGTGDSPKTNPGPGGEYRPDPNDPAAALAFDLLKETATIVCGHSREEPDNPDLHDEPEEIELSDPLVRPPGETVSGRRFRVRVNEKYGYLSGGNSTHCVVKDRPAEEFLSLVETWLDSGCGRLPPSRRKELSNQAAALKHQGDIHDIDIMKRIVERARE